MGIKVGIDLGTTYSAVAMLDERTGQPFIIPNTLGERITPSVIQFTEEGNIIVGSEAKDAFISGEFGCTLAFKRCMGREDAYCTFYGVDYTAEDLSAILLKYLKEEAEKVTGQIIDEAVVTVPAYFLDNERGATIRAAQKAGLKIRQIINEPTAAAMCYGVGHWRENARVLVYDLGGGTFDITLIQMHKDNLMESLQTIGDSALGGKDWDERIRNLIKNRIANDTGVNDHELRRFDRELNQKAENIKKQLTERNAVTLNLYLPRYGQFETEITIEDFEQSTKDLLEKTGRLCERLLKGTNMEWHDVTDILLVGGSTRMRQVSRYLQEISGLKPLRQVSADEAVALGAAIQVHLPLAKYNLLSSESSAKSSLCSNRKYLLGEVGEEKALNTALCIKSVDVVAHSMGVIAVNKEGTHYINKTIVPANQKIPVKCAEEFNYYTSAKGNNEVEIYMLQGDKAPLECRIVGKYVASGITHDRENNPTTIRIQYSYDINGRIHVQVRQGDSNADLPVRKEPILDDISKFGRPIDTHGICSMAESISVVMAVDVSGSMSGSPIEDARQAMCGFVDELGDYQGDVKIGVIAVSDRSEIVQPLTSDFSLCKKAIGSIEDCMTGICNAANPFQDIKRMLENVNGRKVAIVLADGIWINQELAVKEARQCHKKNVEIVGIGFGSADEQFLQEISSGDIKSMFVGQNELKKSFGKIAQEISHENTANKGLIGVATDAKTWLAINE